jgi:hypothetical protein
VRPVTQAQPRNVFAWLGWSSNNLAVAAVWLEICAALLVNWRP